MGSAQILWAITQTDRPAAAAKVLQGTTTEDRLRAEQYRLPQARRNSLCARGLARALLYRWTGRGDWQIESAPSGKPFAVTPEGGAGPALSLSHSQDRVAAAVGNVPSLGIDIEFLAPRNTGALAQRFFGPAEAAFAQNNLAAFYKIWTLREALAKADGAGLAIAANATDLIEYPARTGLWTEGARFWFHTDLDGYSLALAGETMNHQLPVCDRIDLERLQQIG